MNWRRRPKGLLCRPLAGEIRHHMAVGLVADLRPYQFADGEVRQKPNSEGYEFDANFYRSVSGGGLCQGFPSAADYVRFDRGSR